MSWLSPAASGRQTFTVPELGTFPPTAAALVTRLGRGRGRLASLLFPGRLQPTRPAVLRWQICFQIDFFENHHFHIPDPNEFCFVPSGFHGTPDAALEILYFGVPAPEAPVPLGLLTLPAAGVSDLQLAMQFFLNMTIFTFIKKLY